MAGRARKPKTTDPVVSEDSHTQRTHKFSQELADRLVSMVLDGLTVRTACKHEGISRWTFYEWRRRGERGEAPYAKFARDIDRAYAQLERGIVRNVLDASAVDWRAGKWWLEQRNPEDYPGDRLTIDSKVQAGIQQLLDAVQPRMSTGAFDELLCAIEAELGESELVAGTAARVIESDGLH